MSQVQLVCTDDNRPEKFNVKFCAKNIQSAELYFTDSASNTASTNDANAIAVSIAKFPGDVQAKNDCIIYTAQLVNQTLPVRFEWYYVYTADGQAQSTYTADSACWSDEQVCAKDKMNSARWHLRSYPREVPIALLIGLLSGLFVFCCMFTCVSICLRCVKRKRRRKMMMKDQIDYDRLTQKPEENEFLIASPPAAKIVKRASMTQNFLDKYYHPHLQKINEHEGDDDPIVSYDEVQF